MTVPHTLQIEGSLISLEEPKVMGVINATPDSFYGQSRSINVDEILKKAEQMIDEGATFLDIGGYSTRPGAIDISEEEEIFRIAKPIEQIRLKFPQVYISVDTFRSSVAKAAISSGAHIVNDVSGGLLDDKMISAVAAMRVPYILMHMRGNPQTMTKENDYNDLLTDVIFELSQRVELANEAGIKDVIIDPGFGFAKNVQQNFELLNKLEHLNIFQKPLLIGISRKSMIYKTLGSTPEESLNGTTVLNTVALQKGAIILRVHDVKAAVEVVKLTKSLAN
ncbi:MAG: dihydropteroate synthase [Cyclobacteriaceae bacterium]